VSILLIRVECTMARIRESLRHADTTRGQPKEAISALRPPPSPEVPADLTEEVPFIEVGGREVPIEASSSVLASFPKTVLPVTFEASTPPRFATRSSDVRISSVAFRAFPPEPPRLRQVPERFAPELVALHQPTHPISEEYRALVKNLGKQLPAGQSQVLLFMAPTAHTDTSAVLLNLAITRARQDASHDLVVDADLRRSPLAARLGLRRAPGVGDVLAGKESLSRAIQETGQANLYALTAGIAVPETLIRAGEPLRAMLSQLQDHFHWIFVNAPYWDGETERLALVSACHAVYLVLPEASAETDMVKELSQLLLQHGGCLRGYFLI
jgi:Mrp family chromosome partitioning ATPase